jgi:hypothetical protein
VHGLFGWDPQTVLNWLLSNPNGPENREEQERDLLQELNGARSPEVAAAYVLNAIWARQVSQNPALQR